MASCDREVLASRATEFGWVADGADTLCPNHLYLSAAVRRAEAGRIDVRARAAGEDVDAW